MKKRSIIALALALACLFGLSSCQQKANYTTDKLNVWIWDESQRTELEALAQGWSEKTRIEVQITVKEPSAYWQSVNSGVMPDLLWVDDAHVDPLAEDHAILQLDDMVKGSRTVKKLPFTTAVKELFQQNGHTYAVPCAEEVYALWYNAALFDSMRLDYPDESWTWDQVRQTAAKMTNRGTGIYGIVIPAGDLGSWYNLVYAAGGNILHKDENGALVSGWQDPGTRSAMNLLSCMVLESMPSQHIMETVGETELFTNNDVGMILQTTSEGKALMENNTNNRWACTVLPLWTASEEGESAGKRVSMVHGTGWAISSFSTDANASFDLLEVLCGANSEQNDLPAQGEEEQVDPLAAYDQMEAEAELIPMPRSLGTETWEHYAAAVTMYTAWNDPTRMDEMLAQQDNITNTELAQRQQKAEEAEAAAQTAAQSAPVEETTQEAPVTEILPPEEEAEAETPEGEESGETETAKG